MSNIKPSNIRIWIHERDIGKLTRALYEGHGMRLRTESSNNPRVKKFLEAVPYLMVSGDGTPANQLLTNCKTFPPNQNQIKEIHQAVIDNDIDLLREKTAPPVPPVLLSARDTNGLTVLHKAAGLAHTQVVEHLLSMWPDSAADKDATGKTPLHYAASAKNNDRCFNLLVQAGADEETQDNVSGKYRIYFLRFPDQPFYCSDRKSPVIINQSLAKWTGACCRWFRKRPGFRK